MQHSSIPIEEEFLNLLRKGKSTEHLLDFILNQRNPEALVSILENYKEQIQKQTDEIALSHYLLKRRQYIPSILYILKEVLPGYVNMLVKALDALRETVIERSALPLFENNIRITLDPDEDRLMLQIIQTHVKLPLGEDLIEFARKGISPERMDIFISRLYDEPDNYVPDSVLTAWDQQEISISDFPPIIQIAENTRQEEINQTPNLLRFIETWEEEGFSLEASAEWTQIHCFRAARARDLLRLGFSPDNMIFPLAWAQDYCSGRISREHLLKNIRIGRDI